ncbi:hypothetical protein QYM36_014108 [Artemia franciscana]|uniref:Uncharacterized protein n=1 Tax=Artemia franciscana TaxID=6661 RepID=A0AA88HAG7_ARTSF|nr:hypothetical protein QYM36_014108 [Artemia franciscana]
MDAPSFTSTSTLYSRLIDALDLLIRSYRYRSTINTRINTNLPAIPVSRSFEISTVSADSSTNSSWLKNVLDPSTSLGSHSLLWDAVETTPFEININKQYQVPEAPSPLKRDDNTELLALILIDILIVKVQVQNRIINEQKSLIAQLGESNTGYRAIICT